MPKVIVNEIKIIAHLLTLTNPFAQIEPKVINEEVDSCISIKNIVIKFNQIL